MWILVLGFAAIGCGMRNQASPMVGPQGGVLVLDGMELQVPAGALTQEVRISAQAEPAPMSGSHHASSPLYRFEPAGLTFAKPVALTIHTTAQPTAPALFFTHRFTDGLERHESAFDGVKFTTKIDHFSRGFVGESQLCSVGYGFSATYDVCPATNPNFFGAALPSKGRMETS